MSSTIQNPTFCTKKWSDKECKYFIGNFQCPKSARIQSYSMYLSEFSPNAAKYGPEQLKVDLNFKVDLHITLQ